MPGRRRAGYVDDPFGNRIELVDAAESRRGASAASEAVDAADPLPGDRRRAARAGVRTQRRPARCCRASRSCRPRFGASRVTVRRALELVRDDGLIAARQGFGWFVATEPVRQRLEHLGTIEDQLEGGGRHAERRVIEFAFERATRPRRGRVLGVDQVLRVKRLNLADGEPFAVVTVWCPAELGRSLSREDVERSRSTSCSAIALRGATQTIGADVADAGRGAALLHVPVGAPLLRCQRVTTDTDRPPGAHERARLSRPTAPSSSSSSRWPSRAPLPPASASSTTPPDDHPSVSLHRRVSARGPPAPSTPMVRRRRGAPRRPSVGVISPARTCASSSAARPLVAAPEAGQQAVVDGRPHPADVLASAVLGELAGALEVPAVGAQLVPHRVEVDVLRPRCTSAPA